MSEGKVTIRNNAAIHLDKQLDSINLHAQFTPDFLLTIVIRGQLSAPDAKAVLNREEFLLLANYISQIRENLDEYRERVRTAEKILAGKP